FVFKEITENYYILNENKKALEYIPQAILTDDSIKMKVNLYYLIYNILKDSDYDMALKHAQLYYLLKKDTNSELYDDIEELNINRDDLNRQDLVREINEYWKNFKLEFKNDELTGYDEKAVSIRGE
ncbi:MAG: hypothetical protein Q4Q18_02295, partial [Methanobrevibacter sp.]|nr:hypothetical protein [Methanobrevibacter sp.]